MKKVILFSIFSLLFFYACSKETTFPPPFQITPNFHDFQINQFDYDSLRIESHDAMLTTPHSVQQIILYMKEDGDFVPADTLIPDYVSSGDNYYLDFRFTEGVPKEKLYYEFRLQYRMNDNSLADVDSSHLMLKYPYPSAEVFITADQVSPAESIYFQDFDFGNNGLFYHPTGPMGLYEYNFTTGSTRLLVNYPGGDAIAYDSIYIFWDNMHTLIERFNLALDTTDMELDLHQFTFDQIGGLACWQGKLYALLRSINGNFLAVFDENGNPIETIPYPNKTFYLTIDHHIAYSIYTPEQAISMFDLNSRSLIGTKPMPYYDWEGIRVHQGNFYYVAYAKRVIGVIPLSEFELP